VLRLVFKNSQNLKLGRNFISMLRSKNPVGERDSKGLNPTLLGKAEETVEALDQACSQMIACSSESIPIATSIDAVCTKCFEDDDLVKFITQTGDPPGCSLCGSNDNPTASVSHIADHIRNCLGEFFGLADEQLPFQSRGGGYLGAHWDTYELLFNQLEFELPRDQHDRLANTLCNLIGNDVWCNYDWMLLDYDEELAYWWKQFCDTVTHECRYFFAVPEDSRIRGDEPEAPSPLGLLSTIVDLLGDLHMVKVVRAGQTFFRGRCADGPTKTDLTAAQLGPPPREKAVQANRMNPPGIPMMYVAETKEIAMQETGCSRVAVGEFRLERQARILDLGDLPTVPGIFSGKNRRTRLGLIFLHAFAKEISRPVDRTERMALDYIPSQVVTEFIRDHKFHGQRIDGIRYGSEYDPYRRNLVLFATQEDLLEPNRSAKCSEDETAGRPWIRLVDTDIC